MITRTKIVSRGPFGILDLGSSKLACLIAQKSASGEVKLLGQSMHVSEGVKQGEITDMNKFSTAVGKTVDAAERNADTTISTIHIVTPGGSPVLSTHTSRIDLHDDVISRRDITRLLHQQSQPGLPPGQILIQKQPGLYQLDEQKQIENPLGMCGRVLGLDFTSITLSQTSYANLRQAVQQCHLELGSVHHSAVMSAYACLTDDDRELGTLLIDFGGGTTSLALFAEAQLRHAGTVRIGGMNVTRDIAKMLSISLSDAERLKAIDGSVLPAIAGTGQIERLSFPSQGDNFVLSNTVSAEDSLTLSGGQIIQRQFLSDIIRTRCEEILEAIDVQLQTAGLGSARTYNLALTGGASQLTGMSDFVSEFWNKPVALRPPTPLSGPDGQISGGSFSACMGLARYIQ
ncbi:MAG: cell division protein FtsA, partial [Pseudomonadota bacterium]|nr:cell division protein FtsA [Pseudomonadota bacterium]